VIVLEFLLEVLLAFVLDDVSVLPLDGLLELLLVMVLESSWEFWLEFWRVD
jgi:hypothetical protein